MYLHHRKFQNSAFLYTPGVLSSATLLSPSICRRSCLSPFISKRIQPSPTACLPIITSSSPSEPSYSFQEEYSLVATEIWNKYYDPLMKVMGKSLNPTEDFEKKLERYFVENGIPQISAEVVKAIEKLHEAHLGHKYSLPEEFQWTKTLDTPDSSQRARRYFTEDNPPKAKIVYIDPNCTLAITISSTGAYNLYQSDNFITTSILEQQEPQLKLDLQQPNPSASSGVGQFKAPTTSVDKMNEEKKVVAVNSAEYLGGFITSPLSAESDARETGADNLKRNLKMAGIGTIIIAFLTIAFLLSNRGL